MPRGNGTGPRGMGAMTGRGAGFCAGYDVPGFANRMSGREAGRGRGFRGFSGAGRGWGMSNAVGTPGYVNSSAQQDELSVLKSRLQYFMEALETVGKRIEELRKRT